MVYASVGDGAVKRDLRHAATGHPALVGLDSHTYSGGR